MKDVEEVYDYPSQYDYEEFIGTFELEIIDHFDVDDYQGDSWYVLRDGDRVGFLTFGWGSCSGCDALQGCETFDELRTLQKELFDSIVWYDSMDEFKEWMRSKDWSTEWGRPSDEFIKRNS